MADVVARRTWPASLNDAAKKPAEGVRITRKGSTGSGQDLSKKVLNLSALGVPPRTSIAMFVGPWVALALVAVTVIAGGVHIYHTRDISISVSALVEEANNHPWMQHFWEMPYIQVMTSRGEFIPKPFWQYMVVLVPMGPLLFLAAAFFLSVASGEWKLKREMYPEAVQTISSITLSSPLIGFLQMQMFEGKIGNIYFDVEEYGRAYFVVSGLVFFFLCDTVFYWTHRVLHLDIFYRFHAKHHSYRPCTSFAAAAAEVIEVIFNGYATNFIPVFFMPIHGSIFLFASFFNMAWASFLHNWSAVKIPGPIYDCNDHNVHHSFGQQNYNYALYTHFWDRLLGTYRGDIPDYMVKLKAKQE